MAPKLMMVVRPVAGGMRQHVLTLLSGLSDSYDLVLCAPEEAGFRDLGPAVRVRTVDVPATIRPVTDLKCALALRHLILQEKPRLVHSHGFHAGLLTMLACGFVHPPHVCTLHTMAVPRNSPLPKKIFYRTLQRLLLASTQHTVVVSEAVRRAVAGAKRRERLTVISNGVDEERLEPALSRKDAARRLRLESGSKVVGVVARLSPEKGVEYFLRSAALIAASNPEVAFVVIGDGPERSRLEALAAQLRLQERVRFAGEHFPASDFMQLFDVTVVPSVSEGQSLVAIESLFLGCPVVATNVGGLAEVIDEEVGSLVPPADPHALAAAVRLLLESEERERMGERARNLARERFTRERMIAETLKVYELALNSRETKDALA